MKMDFEETGSECSVDDSYGDRVLSEVHMEVPGACGVSEGNLARTVFDVDLLALDGEETDGETTHPPSTCGVTDSDGDLDVPRARRHDTAIGFALTHAGPTMIGDVGLQVWRGALLLSDYLISHPECIEGKVAIELGAGAGLVSLVAGAVAKTVFCTDTGDSVLDNCEQNVQRNITTMQRLAPKLGITSGEGCDVRVRNYDWSLAKPMTRQGRFSWTTDDVDLATKSLQVILAADVVYDDDLTDMFMRQVERLLRPGCVLLVAMEKRINFTIEDLAPVSKSYDHFMHLLNDNGSGGQPRLQAQKIPLDFPQVFSYHRVKELELWCVKPIGY